MNVEVVAPIAGVKVPVPVTKVPPEPVDFVQVPPAASPVIKLDSEIAAALFSQTVVLPSVPALTPVTVTVLVAVPAQP
ncbi:hypothetical protein MCEGE10_02842 [Flavobacteriaceae bacterium]